MAGKLCNNVMDFLKEVIALNRGGTLQYIAAICQVKMCAINRHAVDLYICIPK